MTTSATQALSESERSAILDAEISKYISKGFRIQSQTATTAQLIKPKAFSLVWALIWFVGLGVGLLVYLFWYMAKKDQVVFLRVDAQGRVTKQ